MFKVSWNNGVLVENGGIKILLDPLRSVRDDTKYSFISHAHKDHTYGFLDERKIKFSTHQTIGLFEAISREKVKNAVSCAYGQTVGFHNLELRIVNSGHVFGSGALVLIDGDVTFLYTGDFNLTDTLTQKGITPIECDIMVMETTYGRPDFSFPPREDVYCDIIEWAAKTIKENNLPIFLVYPVGKAQEITKLFNLFTTIPVVTHPMITKTNEIVNEFGDALTFYDLLTDGTDMIKSKSCVALFPTTYSPRTLKSIYRRSKIAVVTGWALLYNNKNVDAAFALSGHADFPQLIHFVRACHPKKVYTVHGYSSDFAIRLRKMGIDAKPLSKN